jgi:hypothetical protein
MGMSSSNFAQKNFFIFVHFYILTNRMFYAIILAARNPPVERRFACQ